LPSLTNSSAIAADWSEIGFDTDILPNIYPEHRTAPLRTAHMIKWGKATNTNPTARFPGGSLDLGTFYAQQLRLPDAFVWETVGKNATNACCAMLLEDGRTVIHFQPFGRATAGAPFAMGNAQLAEAGRQDIVTGDGRLGSHGGSGLSALGGTIRVHELLPGATIGPRHVLKLTVPMSQWVKYPPADGAYTIGGPTRPYRWPARTRDSTWRSGQDTYGINAPAGLPDGSGMGMLVAIPPGTSSGDLETIPGLRLFETLMDYGAILADDSYAKKYASGSSGALAVDRNGFLFSAEWSPRGLYPTVFRNAWSPYYGSGFFGGDLKGARVRTNSPFTRDCIRLIRKCHLVANNSATNIGGGGVRRVAMKPEAYLPY